MGQSTVRAHNVAGKVAVPPGLVSGLAQLCTAAMRQQCRSCSSAVSISSWQGTGATGAACAAACGRGARRRCGATWMVQSYLRQWRVH